MNYATKASEEIRNIAPHYTQAIFAEPQTVYLAEGHSLTDGGYVKDTGYDYSDRLRQWDYDKADSAWQAAIAQNLPQRSANFYEAYLTAYYGRPLKLVHILAGFNVSNGYPYQVFGVMFEQENKAE